MNKKDYIYKGENIHKDAENVKTSLNNNEDELVVVEDLNKYGFNLYENQLCVIIREGRLVTVFRRNHNSPKTTYGSRVENVRYGFV